MTVENSIQLPDECSSDRLANLMADCLDVCGSVAEWAGEFRSHPKGTIVSICGAKYSKMSDGEWHLCQNSHPALRGRLNPLLSFHRPRRNCGVAVTAILRTLNGSPHGLSPRTFLNCERIAMDHGFHSFRELCAHVRRRCSESWCMRHGF
jgi:hypothetical protein